AGAPLVLVGDTAPGGDVAPARQAAVHEHPRSLVPGQARRADGGPGSRIFEDGPVRARDLRRRVPVAPIAVARHVAVDDEQLVPAVIVQVAELGSPGPS